jgi:ATP-dependent helicase/nuclease subunit B
MASKPRVLTIPASAPFLRTLIAALLDGRLVPGFPRPGDPLALADATLYLPTRRACRLARDVFLEAIGGDAAILPRIVPIGDVDEDEIAFAEAAQGKAALELPEAIGGFQRRTLLAELILKWAEAIRPREQGQAPLVANGPAAALRLADDLARLMDDITTRQVKWHRLDDLVPTELDKYWEITLDFLKVAREWWPAILEERGLIDPAERRDRLIEAERARLATTSGPVIAAGSTGSIPATAMMLDTIAKLPQGAVVLPGLDTDLDDAAWEMIGRSDDGFPGHPQFAMHGLLRRFGIAREAVTQLAPPGPHGRERIVSEALRPADATEHWKTRLVADGFASHANTALATVTAIEAANAEEEALVIAITLREALNTPGKTAALVTPDRGLSRRVLAALIRWDVAVDDSGGDSLADTPEGVFARLIAEVALGGAEPVPLLALLKHKHSPFDQRAVAALELALLRGPRPQKGTAGLARALETLRRELERARRGEASALHRSDPRITLTDAELDAAAALIGRLAVALKPLEELKGKNTFAFVGRLHRSAVDALMGETKALADAFDDIETAERLVIEPGEYAELFHTAIADRTVRRPEQPVRIRIFGPLEARLQNVDRLVLGGLVESVWPPETRADPWLSRPMRHALGLDLPERRIGLSAHDFAQSLGASEIFLTRAAKLGGAPTVPSRFVQRLAAVAGDKRWSAVLKKGEDYLGWARAMDEPANPPKAAARPSPRPPIAARPRRLSVTEIEHWLRDPYTIYAKHILRLQPLDEVDTPPGAADRGTVIHNAIGDFAKAYAKELPADSVKELLALGRKHFEPYRAYEEARAFWWPRFERIAHWFAAFEIERRGTLHELHAEIGGRVEIPFGSEIFTLTTRADRIEHLKDGRFAILDYKTGAPPTEPQVRTGLAPQLTLEAAILRKGGFEAIPAGGTVAKLIYIRLRGGDPAGEDKPIDFKEGTADEHADRALAKLTGLVARFADPNVPYHSLVHPMWSTHYGTYDHLARVKEWSLTGGADVDGGTS